MVGVFLLLFLRALLHLDISQSLIGNTIRERADWRTLPPLVGTKVESIGLIGNSTQRRYRSHFSPRLEAHSIDF